MIARSVPMTGAPLLALLTVAAALGQLATSLYLPSFPDIRDSLETSLGSVQASLAVYYAGFALGQLAIGPVADWLGRKPVLVAGALTVSVGSLLCAGAPSIEVLITGRLIQAVGAAATQVAARAIARDMFDGPALGRAMATLAMAFALVPGFAPLVGGLIDHAAGWRPVFLVPLVVGLALAVSQTRLTESLPVVQPIGGVAGFFGRYRPVVTNFAYLRFAVVGALLFGGIAAFLAGTPTVMMDRIGVTAAEYGLYPAITIPGFFVGGLLVRRFSGRLDDLALVRLALPLLLAGAVLMLMLPAMGLVARWTVVVPMALFVAGAGVAFPASSAGALRLFPHSAGAAAALLGASAMATGAVAATLVSLLPLDITLAYGAVMLASVALAAILALWPRR